MTRGYPLYAAFEAGLDDDDVTAEIDTSLETWTKMMSTTSKPRRRSLHCPEASNIPPD
jgi:hypothetical protein